MSSNIIIQKPQVIPGIITNRYARENDLLNCCALKARYDLRDLNTYHNNIEKNKMEYRKKLLSSQLRGIENDDMSLENSNLLFEFKILMNSRNNELKYRTPIEERQKLFFDYYKKFFNDMTKKGGIEYYINTIVPKFLHLQKTQRSIQNKIIKSKSVIIKNKLNIKKSKVNLEKKLHLKGSSISESCEDSYNKNIFKKIPLLKLKINNDNKISFLENSKNKLPSINLLSSINGEDNNKSLMNNIIDNNKNEKNKINYKLNNNKKNISKSLIPKEKMTNSSCEFLKNKFIFDKNFTPIINTASYKILSKRGNIQFDNSICRTKDINQYLHYNSYEVNDILKQINQRRKKFYQ